MGQIERNTEYLSLQLEHCYKKIALINKHIILFKRLLIIASLVMLLVSVL